MCFDDPFADREAKPCAMYAFRPGNTIKLIEYPIQVLSGDSNPLIGNMDLDTGWR